MEGLVRSKSMDPAFWKGKRVLLTGHTGFKGAWLSLWLKKLGANLIGYSLPPPTNPNLFELANISDGITSIEGNINDFENLKSIFKKHKPEIVLHMAAQALVRYSYEHPLETYMTNVIGTANVLECVRKENNVKALLIVTSDKCYENKGNKKAYVEDDPMGGYDPYSSSKGCAELVTSAFHHSFFSGGIGLASCRAGNVIGGGDWAEDRLIPDIVRGIFSKQKIKIRSPQAIRPWQHVLEPLSGYLVLAEKLWLESSKFSSAWNFGPDDEGDRPVLWMVEQFLKLWGEKVDWVIKEDKKLHEASYLKLDSTKARKHLDWRPSWNIDRALEKTAEWYKTFKEKKDLSQVTLSQIKQYEESLILKKVS